MVTTYLVDECLMDKFKELMGDRMARFSTIHGNYVHLTDAAQQVDMNRDVTLSTTMTRTKPNCFNTLHQVERKLMLMDTGTDSDLTKARSKLNANLLMSEFGLTPAEAAATLNLCVYIPEDVKKLLCKIGSTYGMWGGPVGHTFVGAKALRVGYKPTVEDEWWSVHMASD